MEVITGSIITGIFGILIAIIGTCVHQDKKFQILQSEHKALCEKNKVMQEALSKEHGGLNKEHDAISTSIGSFQTEWRAHYEKEQEQYYNLSHEQKDMSNTVKQIVAMEAEMRQMAEKLIKQEELIMELQSKNKELQQKLLKEKKRDDYELER